MKKLSANKRHQLEEEMRIVARLYRDLPDNVQNHDRFGNLIVTGDKVKLASWTTSYHNGDISNYKERDPKPGELVAHIPALEEAWQEVAWRNHVAQFKSDALVGFYKTMGIDRRPTNE